MTRRYLMRTALAIAAIGALPPMAFGQSAGGAPNVTLQQEIAQADSAMFAAYNAHDAAALAQYFSPDLEFFHDTGGLLTKAQAMAGLTSTFTQSPDIHHRLVGALEVYPIRDYGAIEIGAHQFCHRENGQDVCGTFKFTQVWRRTVNGWQVTRAVSYGH
jgi:ketosteroid isomerase-like protein